MRHLFIVLSLVLQIAAGLFFKDVELFGWINMEGTFYYWGGISAGIWLMTGFSKFKKD